MASESVFQAKRNREFQGREQREPQMVGELQAARRAIARSPEQGVARQGVRLAWDGCERPEILKGSRFILQTRVSQSRDLIFLAR